LTAEQENPFKHQMKIAEYSEASPDLVAEAVKGALEAKKSWCRTSLQDRAAIFYRAAALLQGPYKYQMMAATMIGQGKNAYQADIDCVAEVKFDKT
jgi:1-pyrroline-5-carboxylate dehydrogenase